MKLRNQLLRFRRSFQPAISSKTEQLDSLKSTVKASVEDSVKAEFKSYSSAVQNNRPQEHAISSETLKNVVKNVVQEEVQEEVSEVFQAIRQKPKIDAYRRATGNAARPVKVTVSSSLVVDQTLSKARNLKDVEKMKTVFVCPDRSSEQRGKQRGLVNKLKETAAKEPVKRHYIRSGKPEDM